MARMKQAQSRFVIGNGGHASYGAAHLKDREAWSCTGHTLVQRAWGRTLVQSTQRGSRWNRVCRPLNEMPSGSASGRKAVVCRPNGSARGADQSKFSFCSADKAASLLTCSSDSVVEPLSSSDDTLVDSSEGKDLFEVVAEVPLGVEGASLVEVAPPVEVASLVEVDPGRRMKIPDE